jgi:hypothetical protein
MMRHNHILAKWETKHYNYYIINVLFLLVSSYRPSIVVYIIIQPMDMLGTNTLLYLRVCVCVCVCVCVRARVRVRAST